MELDTRRFIRIFIMTLVLSGVAPASWAQKFITVASTTSTEQSGLFGHILPIFEKMQQHDLPVLLHPRKTNTTPDYKDEERSKFLVYTNFGWPFETSLTMARLAFGGVLEK